MVVLFYEFIEGAYFEISTLIMRLSYENIVPLKMIANDGKLRNY